jgi:predicted dehydrogenase
MAAEQELRVAICGSGNRSRTVWQRHLQVEPGFALAGVQDPDPASLARAFELGLLTQERAFGDLDEMLDSTRPDGLIVCPPHEFHAEAIEAALERGLDVLVEKPFTTDLGDAVRLAELAEANGRTLAVVQNWRVKSVGRALRRAVSGGLVGTVSHIFFRYLRDRELPHLPEYLFDEPDPMLYALTVHHLDLYRYVLGQEFVRVEGRSFRPPWSRYRHPSLVQLWLETDGGVVVSYSGTISSRNGGHFRWENLLVEGELGSLYNDTDTLDPPLLLSRRGDPEPIELTADVTVRDRDGQYDLADLEILRNFRAAVLEGAELISPARENLGTVAAIEAVKRSLRERRSVEVQPV